jgi:hypothetical protein
VGLAAQECGPGLTVAFGRWLDPVRPQDLPDRGWCDLDAEHGEFAVDAPIPPGAVLAGQAQDKGLDGATGWRPAGPLATRGFGVTTAHEVTVPPQDRVRGDDQVQLPQFGSGELVEKRGQEGAVRRGDARPVDLPL